MTQRLAVMVVYGISICSVAHAQSLFQQPQAPAPLPGEAPAGAAAAQRLEGYSLFVVVPPPPRTYQKNDIIQIIINESSIQKYEQSLDTDKRFDLKAKLGKFPSLRHLLEAQLRTGDSSPVVEVEADSNTKFKGDGTYERKDRFTTRISATVLDVKPNGVLVLEGKSVKAADKETTTIVISGTCRPQDVTAQNSVQSTQLAELIITVKNDGQVKDTATKGLISQFFDLIFNF